MNPRRAFTLIELLIVVAIVAVLAAMAAANFLEARTRSRVARVLNDQRTMSLGLESYRVDASAYPPGPNSFINPALASETWRISTPVAYISHIPADTFFKPPPFAGLGGPFGPGGPFIHYLADLTVNETWLIWSYGPDGDMEFTELVYDPTNGTLSDGDIYRAGSLP